MCGRTNSMPQYHPDSAINRGLVQIVEQHGGDANLTELGPRVAYAIKRIAKRCKFLTLHRDPRVRGREAALRRRRSVAQDRKHERLMRWMARHFGAADFIVHITQTLYAQTVVDLLFGGREWRMGGRVLLISPDTAYYSWLNSSHNYAIHIDYLLSALLRHTELLTALECLLARWREYQGTAE